MSENKGPKEQYLYGGIKLAVWEQVDSKGRSYETFTLSRSYKDQAGNWKETDKITFFEKDLLCLEKIISGLFSGRVLGKKKTSEDNDW